MDNLPKPPDSKALAISLFVKKLVVRTFVFVFTILVFLSLISYKPEDTHILAGGLPNYATISNWIGLFGAYVSSWLFEWIGFASYIGVTLVLVCITNRAFTRHSRPVTRIYGVGLFLFVWGCSMLLANFTELLPGWAESLNITQTPGGAIGQRFCAPWVPGSSGGWLAYVVNQTGSIIISSAMIVVGLMTVWYFDWHDRARGWLNIFFKIGENQGTRVDKGEGLASKLTRSLSRKKKKVLPAGVVPEISQDEDSVRTENIHQGGIPGVPNESPGGSMASLPRARNSKVVYKLPALELLNKPSSKSTTVNPGEIESKREVLQDTLDSFSIDATVGDTTSGPRVTLFEIKPAPGVKVERISSLANNISMNLKAESLRILTPIPGKDTVGIEVPNRASSSVSIRALIESSSWKKSQASIPLILGKSISGTPVILDLAKAPHLLIAGATGSGKSVCMNTLILSLLYRFTPEQLKLIMIDPKVVEFTGYNTLPHLVTPVVTQVKKVPAVLRWVLNQMEWRYDILSKVGVRNIAGFNARKANDSSLTDDSGEPIPDRLPFMIVIIDELADIMMTAKADVETSLARIAQLARAVGIHVVVATQRPSVNVITGIIKANFPTRIAFQVTSVVDSRTILDGKGAESLLGRGDMLFKPPGGAKLERTQGAMVDDDEIERVVSFVSEQAQPEFMEDILSFGTTKESGDSALANNPSNTSVSSEGTIDEGTKIEAVDSDEALTQKAISVILRDRRATTSHIQRRLRIGYNRAALIIEKLEQRGIIGPQIGTAPRQILVDNSTDTDETQNLTSQASDGQAN